MKEIVYKVIKYQQQYIKRNNKKPSIEEIAEELKLDIIDVVKALEAIQKYMLNDNFNSENHSVDKIDMN